MTAAPTHALAQFAAELTFADLPADAITALKRMILDTLGCAIAATSLGDGCRETVELMRCLGGKPASTIIGCTDKVSAPNAAFANGALVHALNYDPIGAEIGHLGVVCLAAPLAMAETVGDISGAEFLAASAAACEISARITSAITRTGRRPSEKFLSGQLLSYFGAAAGAGRVLHLDAIQMRSALGLALIQMSGSRQVVLSGDPPAKAIYGAFPNHAGVLGALLSKQGMGADVDVFGEPAGLYPMIYGGSCDLDVLTAGLGSEFLLTKVDFKLSPTSDQVHPFIEATRSMGPLDASAIHTVEIAAPSKLRPWCEPLDKRRRPENPAAAANSIPFMTAVSLAHGTVRLQDVTVRGLRDSEALAIADRTVCRLDDSITAAVISVRTTDGQRRQATALHGQGQPATQARLADKFRDCCHHAAKPIAPETVEEIIGMVDRLPELDDIGRLVALASSGA